MKDVLLFFIQDRNNKLEHDTSKWGVCSSHCKEKSSSSKIMEAKLSLLSQKDCSKLGEELNIDIEREFCAAK